MSNKLVKDSKEKKSSNKVNLSEHPTRQEIIDIMTQLTDNMNQMGNYLMQDVNTMYSNHVFPFQIRLSVLEDILIEKGITSSEEISKKIEEKIEKLKEQAKPIDENGKIAEEVTEEAAEEL